MEDIDVRRVVVTFLALLVSLTVHEFAHAFTADRLGDPTPRRHGRVTLNPMVIIRAHPIGAFLLPLLGPVFGVIFAFASTPVDPTKVRRSVSIRKAEFLIALAGPMSNVILGVIAGAVCISLVSTFPVEYRGYLLIGSGGDIPALAEAGSIVGLVDLTRMMVLVNVILALFNLIPIPPLDGFTVATAFFPNTGFGQFVTQYQFMLILLLFYAAGHIFTPFIQGAQELLFTFGAGM